MADPGDNGPPPGHEGERHIVYGPLRRRGTYEDHGDYIEERNRDVTHVARIGARGDVIDEAVVPGLVMLSAAMERMSVATIPTNSDDSIGAVESAHEETAGTSRIRNVLTRCCNTDTSSMDGGETSNEQENPSMHSLNGEILSDLQSVDIISEVVVNAGSDIKEVSHKPSELSATPSGDDSNLHEVAELTEETTPKEVVKSVLDDLIETVCPEPEKLVRPILDELVDKVVSMQPPDADVPIDVLGPKEKAEKVSKIRQMMSTILCKKGPNGNESASTISTGSAEAVRMSDIEGIVSSKLQVDAQMTFQANSDDKVSTDQSSVQNVDSVALKKKSKKSKIFRLFQRKNKDRNKVPKVRNNKVHPEDVEKCPIQTNSSNEAVNESEVNPPRVSAAQTQIICQKADDTGTLPIGESPKKPKKKDVLRKMFHYCICIGSAYDEVNDDDECDQTTVSLESN